MDRLLHELGADWSKAMKVCAARLRPRSMKLIKLFITVYSTEVSIDCISNYFNLLL